MNRRTEEWRRAFTARLAAIPESDPLWDGILNTIDLMVLDTVEASCVPGLLDGARAFNDGRQSALIDLRGALQEALSEAKRAPDGG